MPSPQQLELKVHSPLVVQVVPASLQVDAGGTATFTCSVTGGYLQLGVINQTLSLNTFS